MMADLDTVAALGLFPDHVQDTVHKLGSCGMAPIKDGRNVNTRQKEPTHQSLSYANRAA